MAERPDEGVRAALEPFVYVREHDMRSLAMPAARWRDGVRIYRVPEIDGEKLHPLYGEPAFRAALSTPVPEEGRTEMAGGDVIACVDPDRWDHADAPQLAYANGWNDALAGLPRGSASAAEGEPVRWPFEYAAPFHAHRYDDDTVSLTAADGRHVGWFNTHTLLPLNREDLLEQEAVDTLSLVEMIASAMNGVASALPSPLPQGEPVAELIATLQAACETAWANSSAIGLFKAAAEALAAAEARADRAEEDVLDRLYARFLAGRFSLAARTLRTLEGAMLPADRAALHARTILKETAHDA